MKTIRSMTLVTLVAIGMGLVFFTLPAQAQAPRFQITASTDRGGGTSSGGPFVFNGTIGQPDAGAATSGSAFSITGGFQAEFVGPAGLLPRLSIRLASANVVVLSWPNPSTGYVLQQTTDMGAASGGWANVTQVAVVNGVSKEVTLPAAGRFAVFRLRKP